MKSFCLFLLFVLTMPVGAKWDAMGPVASSDVVDGVSLITYFYPKLDCMPIVGIGFVSSHTLPHTQLSPADGVLTVLSVDGEAAEVVPLIGFVTENGIAIAWWPATEEAVVALAKGSKARFDPPLLGAASFSLEGSSSAIQKALLNCLRQTRKPLSF